MTPRPDGRSTDVEPILKQGPRPKRQPKRLAQFSARRKAQQDERAQVIAFVRERDSVCRITAVPFTARDALEMGPCAGPLDVHEIIPRSAWANGYLDEDNCVLICRAHHQYVDANPDEAHKLGLHGYSHERPEHSWRR